MDPDTKSKKMEGLELSLARRQDDSSHLPYSVFSTYSCDLALTFRLRLLPFGPPSLDQLNLLRPLRPSSSLLNPSVIFLAPL